MDGIIVHALIYTLLKKIPPHNVYCVKVRGISLDEGYDLIARCVVCSLTVQTVEQHSPHLVAALLNVKASAAAMHHSAPV